VPVTEADVTALEADFGYRPQVQVAEGIAQFVDWYRAYTAFKLSAAVLTPCSRQWPATIGGDRKKESFWALTQERSDPRIPAHVIGPAPPRPPLVIQPLLLRCRIRYCRPWRDRGGWP
jgi:hypothetical protein